METQKEKRWSTVNYVSAWVLIVWNKNILLAIFALIRIVLVFSELCFLVLLCLHWEVQFQTQCITFSVIYPLFNSTEFCSIAWPHRTKTHLLGVYFSPDRSTWKVYLHLTQMWLQMKKFPPVQRLRPHPHQHVWRSTKLQRCASLCIHVLAEASLRLVSKGKK